MVHHERYVTVYTTYLELQEMKSGEPEKVEFARMSLRLKPNETVKTTWISAYEIASKLLVGSFAQGDAEAMRKSYIKAAKWNRESDERAFIMSTALPETYKMLGFSTPRMGN